MVSHPDEVADLIRTAAEAAEPENQRPVRAAVSPEAFLTLPSSWPRTRPDPAGQTERLKLSQVMPRRPMPSHPEGKVAMAGLRAYSLRWPRCPRASVWPTRTACLPQVRAAIPTTASHACSSAHAPAILRNPERSTSRSPVACADTYAFVAPAIPKTSRARCSSASSTTSTISPGTRAVSRPGCSRSRATR